jgi:type IV secretory pathway TrbL component
MEAVLEILLIFIVFPMFASVLAKGGPGAKIGYAVLAIVLSFLGALASVFAGTLRGPFGHSAAWRLSMSNRLQR